MVVTLPRSEDINWTARAVIDGDIHPALASPKSLDPYLSQHWRAHRQQLSGFSYSGATYPRANPNAARVDSWPPNGQPPGSDLNFMREQLLDRWELVAQLAHPEVAEMGDREPRRRRVRDGQNDLVDRRSVVAR